MANPHAKFNHRLIRRDFPQRNFVTARNIINRIHRILARAEYLYHTGDRIIHQGCDIISDLNLKRARHVEIISLSRRIRSLNSWNF